MYIAKKNLAKYNCHVPVDGIVAQLVRVPACHAGGREFEPRQSRHLNLEPH